MKKEATIMAMPVKINIVDPQARVSDFEEVFDYLRKMDKTFSTFNRSSEISKINSGAIIESDFSPEVKKVLALAHQTKKETNGYFEVFRKGKIDPAGLVKGLSIYESANILAKKGFRNFYIEIAGDIQVAGLSDKDKKWKIGIENPFNRKEIVKVVELSDQGIATSGTYTNGLHIYDPIGKKDADEISSISVIGPNVYEADRFATAAFAMGSNGLQFLERKDGLEGLMVTKDKRSYQTNGFKNYLVN